MECADSSSLLFRPAEQSGDKVPALQIGHYQGLGRFYICTGDRIQLRSDQLVEKPRMELLVNFDEFWPLLQQDILAARDAVLIQTFALEGDEVGRKLSAALSSSAAANRSEEH